MSNLAAVYSQKEKHMTSQTTRKSWKATKQYLNQRGTKIRVFRVPFRAPLLPPFSPHFSPLFPLQALFTLPPLLPSSPPPFPPLFWLPENSDLGTPLISVLFSVLLKRQGRATQQLPCAATWGDNVFSRKQTMRFPKAPSQHQALKHTWCQKNFTILAEIPLFLPLAITAFGGPEGYFSLAIIAFGEHFNSSSPKTIIA